MWSLLSALAVAKRVENSRMTRKFLACRMLALPLLILAASVTAAVADGTSRIYPSYMQLESSLAFWNVHLTDVVTCQMEP